MIRKALLSGLILILLHAGQVMAQDSDAASSESGEKPDCIPASEFEQASGDQSGPTDEDEADETDWSLPICEEEDEEPAAQVASTDTASEEGPGDGVDDEDFGRDFDPTDEISEDYPIPLPSDI